MPRPDVLIKPTPPPAEVAKKGQEGARPNPLRTRRGSDGAQLPTGQDLSPAALRGGTAFDTRNTISTTQLIEILDVKSLQTGGGKKTSEPQARGSERRWSDMYSCC